MKRRTGLAQAIVSVCLVLTLALPDSTEAATPRCRVRNGTQDTVGTSLKRMVQVAHDGDRLRVRGTCPGEVVIDADIVIRGLDGAVLTGRGRTRVLRVRPGTTVTLTDLIIQRGRHDLGAGIRIGGTLRIVRSFVQDNRSGFAGGGIYNSGTLRVVDSVIRRNHETSFEGGGGIASDGRLLVLRRTRVIANATTGGFGGGVETVSPTTIVDSVVRGNEAEVGGGIWDEAAVNLVDSVVRGNSALLSGGGIAHVGGTLSLTGTSVTDNTAGVDGGGIFTFGDPVTLDASSSVTGNVPDQCIGTPAC